MGGIKLDVKKFEELFCIVPGDKKKEAQATPKMVQKTQFKTLLDIRRANNVSIGLSRYTRRGLNTADLARAIRAMDESVLTSDDLTTIQNLLPTPEERALLELYNASPRSPDDLPLAPAESFMLATLAEKDFAFHVEAFAFKLHLRAECDELNAKIAKMTDVARTLKRSERLKILLRTVLELGNLTNYQYGAGGGGGAGGFRAWMGKEAKALGIKIDGLARLKDVKSADGKWSLMNFLVDMLLASRPDVSFVADIFVCAERATLQIAKLEFLFEFNFHQVLDVSDEFSDLKLVRHYDIRDLSSQLVQLESGLAKLRNYRPSSGSRDYTETVLIPLLNTAKTEITNIRTDFEAFASAWTEAARYLGEEVEEYAPILDAAPGAGAPRPATSHNKKQPGHVFITLDLFFQAFGDAVAQNRKRKEDEERRVRREIAAEADRIKREERKRERQREQERKEKEEAEAMAAAGDGNGSGSGAEQTKDHKNVSFQVPVTPPGEEDSPPVPSQGPPSSPPQRLEEAKEMFRRFSMMQTRPVVDEDDDDDTEEEEGDGNHSPNTPDGDDMSFLDEYSYDVTSPIDRTNGPGGKDGMGVGGVATRSVCNKCFLGAEECECLL
ncbi:hypothetical protein HK104_005733 [Borealophlyctis nickersoniae]|nr:hypothetical protein HK104_005733 [Borealophlyctis nickersoniae]